MWVLFIVSTLIGSDTDAKVTHFQQFDTEIQCIIDQAILEVSFQNNETSFCLYEK